MTLEQAIQNKIDAESEFCSADVTWADFCIDCGKTIQNDHGCPFCFDCYNTILRAVNASNPLHPDFKKATPQTSELDTSEADVSFKIDYSAGEIEACSKCKVELIDNSCPSCHVYHGDPCASCGERGFHLASCEDYHADTEVTGECKWCGVAPCGCPNV